MNTLVLSRTWQADRVVSWQDAMRLIFSGRAEVVEQYADKIVRSASAIHIVPSVIRMLSGRAWRHTREKMTKRAVWRRDGGNCQYCRKAVSMESMTYDHVLPKSRGGKTVWTNIVLSCVSCNQKKGNQTPIEAGMRLATEPKTPAKTQMIRSVSQGVEAWMRYCGEK